MSEIEDAAARILSELRLQQGDDRYDSPWVSEYDSTREGGLFVNVDGEIDVLNLARVALGQPRESAEL